MKQIWAGWFLILFCISCNKANNDTNIPVAPTPTPIVVSPDFIRAVDLSYTPEILAAGTSFKDNNVTKELTQLIRDKGVNTVRLRLWHTPADVHSGLSETLDFAKALTAKGFNIWLDIHYSDTWADPAHQSLPAAWKNAGLMVLKDSVYQYTTRVMQAFKTAGINLKIVQTGNEINSGFLWDQGRVGGNFDANWSNFALLLKEGIRAVKDQSNGTKVMVHFAGIDGADWFFSNIAAQGISYDYIGLSFYPIWHGKSLDALNTGINALITKYAKPIVIAETAYPFTLGWNDYTNNIVGLSTQLIPGYDASQDGQNAYIKALLDLSKKLPNQMGLGVCWWAPEWVSFKGPTATNGSTWENQTLFDFNNNALPALNSLGGY